MRSSGIFLTLVLSWALCGCSDDDPGAPPSPLGSPSEPQGPCSVVTQSFEITSAAHVEACSALPSEPRPPAGGPHYSSWANFQTYDFPIARGYVIHAMEHGAVVFYYNCPEGCADEVAEVQALIDAQPEDVLCYGTASQRRAVLLPDPTLDVRWAMSAWGFTLRASCVDTAAFGKFYGEHYAMAPENFCNPGVAFSSSPCQ